MMNPTKLMVAGQSFLSAIIKKKEGQAMVEYALILALVAVVVIGVLVFLGHSVHNTLDNVGNAVNG